SRCDRRAFASPERVLPPRGRSRQHLLERHQPGDARAVARAHERRGDRRGGECEEDDPDDPAERVGRRRTRRVAVAQAREIEHQRPGEADEGAGSSAVTRQPLRSRYARCSRFASAPKATNWSTNAIAWAPLSSPTLTAAPTTSATTASTYSRRCSAQSGRLIAASQEKPASFIASRPRSST